MDYNVADIVSDFLALFFKNRFLCKKVQSCIARFFRSVCRQPSIDRPFGIWRYPPLPRLVFVRRKLFRSLASGQEQQQQKEPQRASQIFFTHWEQIFVVRRPNWAVGSHFPQVREH